MAETLFQSEIRSLSLLHRGKVRDVYSVGTDHMLIVTTDRLSAFDVVLPTPIPGKGAVLTELSNFWFARTRHVVPNHLADLPLARVLIDPAERAPVEGRSVVVHKMKALPVEAIVRGYIVGSGWKEYRQRSTVCGIALPSGLREADQLPEPIFTPSTKAAVGSHDENISFDKAAELIGADIAAKVRDVSVALYKEAAEYARGRGIIIADTKFEFGLDPNGRLTLIDEALTPDSSRFWPRDTYRPGGAQPSFDKQFVRDYLESIKWNKQPPVPSLPDEVVAKTREKYLEAFRRITGRDLA